jgi:hypothetical protein
VIDRLKCAIWNEKAKSRDGGPSAAHETAGNVNTATEPPDTAVNDALRKPSAIGDTLGGKPETSATAELSKEQPWSNVAPEYLPLTEAEKLTDGRLSVPTLSKMMTPTGEMRYMRKRGHRCKVHIADFYRHLRSRQSDPEYVKLLVAFMACEGKGDMRFAWKCSTCGAVVPKTVDRCPDRNCSGHEPASFNVNIERVPPPKPRR